MNINILILNALVNKFSGQCRVTRFTTDQENNVVSEARLMDGTLLGRCVLIDGVKTACDMPKDKIKLVIDEKIKDQYRYLNKFWSNEIADDFKAKTEGIIDRLFDVELTDEDIKLLSGIL